jgi:NAD(P)-dependent dehydrogenase (short-subunit alcohol dehydrogenase family)
VLTALMNKPKRLVYVSSGMHYSSDAKSSLADLTWQKRGDNQWSDSRAYCDSKLHNILLTNAVSHLWPNVQANSLDPGWVPTKMGGSRASGDIDAAVRTYVYLAEGANGSVTGKYYFNSKERQAKSEALDKSLQDHYLRLCEELTGVPFPKL